MIPHVIHARNVNDAFNNALWWMRTSGVHEDTRNGLCLVAPGPVITCYSNPTERILWEPRRDANPVFHLMESIWMLAGEHKVDFLLPFNGRFSTYAEDDGVVHGAYGYRWRFGHCVDQLRTAVQTLRREPNSRRVVIAMWDPIKDIHGGKKDIPCNTHIYLDCRGGKLNMTVCCRSNDMLWGAYGANVVHMSVLQEVIAHGVGVPVGSYCQFSNNFHAYTENEMMSGFLKDPHMEFPDHFLERKPTPLLQYPESAEDFLDDCARLVYGYGGSGSPWRTEFFRKVAVPLHNMYLARKDNLSARWSHTVDDSTDWGLAFKQWLERREQNLPK